MKKNISNIDKHLNEQLSIEKEIKINERSLAFLNAQKVMHTNALSLGKFKDSPQAQLILRIFDKQKIDIVVIDSLINSIRKRQILLVEKSLMHKRKHFLSDIRQSVESESA